VKIDDGNWYPVIAEVIVRTGKMPSMCQWREAGDRQARALGKDAALSNTADSWSGKGFQGRLDFLRVLPPHAWRSEDAIDEVLGGEFGS